MFTSQTMLLCNKLLNSSNFLIMPRFYISSDNLNAEGCSEASNVKSRLFNGSKLSNSSSTASLPLSYYYFDDSYEFSCRAGDGSNSVKRVEKNSEVI